MDFSGLFEMQGMLFTIMILGYIFRKVGMISDSGKALLTDLVLYVTLPASILKSFQIEFSHQILVSCLSVIAVAVGIQIGAWLLGMILYPGFPDERKKVLQYATICSNAGILGNPIAEGIFGSIGLLYASIYTIPQRTFMWSIGKVSTHPCILSVVAGLLIMVLQIPLPGFISLTIKNIAGGNTFLAMALVGTILAEVPLRTLPERDTIYYSFIRLFFIPFLVWLACHFAQVDNLVTGVSVVLSGMPAASVTAVLAAKYGKDEVFATKCVVLSTLLSMITVPVWCMFLA